MKIQEVDVVIVGAGPAGTACALALRNSGLRVALLDKEVFPRHKPCGDAIPGPALKWLKQLLPDAPAAFQAFTDKHKIQTSKVFLLSGRSIAVTWVLEAYNSPRYTFDHFLLNLVKQHTNTTVWEGTGVKSISRKAGKVEISTTDPEQVFHCKMVLGCDGANSIVSRTLNKMPESYAADSVAISAYYSKLKAPTDANCFYLLDKIPGYFWIFPVGGDTYNVGLGMYQPQKRFDGNIKEAFQDILQQHPMIREQFREAVPQSKIKGFRLPLAGKQVSLSGEYFLLAGDAARLIDPLGGHGIDKAMQSGIIAATHITQCFQQQRFDATFNQQYDNRIEQAIGKALRQNFRVMNLLMRFPGLVGLAHQVIRMLNRLQLVFNKSAPGVVPKYQAD